MNQEGVLTFSVRSVISRLDWSNSVVCLSLIKNAWSAENGNHNLDSFSTAGPAKLGNLASQDTVSPGNLRSFTNATGRDRDADFMGATAVIDQA